MTEPFDLTTALISDDDGTIVKGLRGGLAGQMETCRQAWAEEVQDELRRRHEWHADAMQTAYDAIPLLRRRVRLHGIRSTDLQSKTGSAPTVEPSTRLLVEMGWLAWDYHFEAEALRILGGIGGLMEGHMGRAIFQASAFMRSHRSYEATVVLDDAVRHHVDISGEASAMLSMLWRMRRNPAWVALARKVADRGASETARAVCLSALVLADEKSMNWRAGPFDEQRNLH